MVEAPAACVEVEAEFEIETWLLGAVLLPFDAVTAKSPVYGSVVQGTAEYGCEGAVYSDVEEVGSERRVVAGVWGVRGQLSRRWRSHCSVPLELVRWRWR
jgi:hypothetical protein